MGENSGGARGRARSRGGGVRDGRKRSTETYAAGRAGGVRKNSLRNPRPTTTDEANTASSASMFVQKVPPPAMDAREHSDEDSVGDDGYATPGRGRIAQRQNYEQSNMPTELTEEARKDVTLRRLRRTDISRTKEEKKVLEAVYETNKFGHAMICPFCGEDKVPMNNTSRSRKERTQTWTCQTCNGKISGFHAEKWILHNWHKLFKRYEKYLRKDGTDGDRAAWQALGVEDKQFDQNLHRVFIETEIKPYELDYLKWILEGGYERLR